MATDTLTVTFSLTADFQTLQTVRHALAAADRQARLSSLLSETLVDGLADRRPLELTVYCTLRVPRPRSQPARTGLPLPCCQAGVARLEPSVPPRNMPVMKRVLTRPLASALRP